MQITVVGLASKKSLTLKVTQNDLTLKLMDFLIQNNIPISSSCSGEGVCKKCVVNINLLSCSLTVEKFLKFENKVEIGYL